MNELKHHLMMASHYASLAEAAEDYATFDLYHALASHHVKMAHRHEADGIVSRRVVPELRNIVRGS